LRNPEELKELLEEFEELAERHGLTSKEKTKMVVKYVDKETKKFWKRLEGYGDDYVIVTNFIWPYLHQISIYSHGLNGYGKPLKRPFDRYQSRLEAISNGRDIRQINW